MSNTIKRARVNSRIGALNKCLADIECKFKDYEELLMIRKRIAAGSMSEELYKFLNVNGSLESLLHGLWPRMFLKLLRKIFRIIS